MTKSRCIADVCFSAGEYEDKDGNKKKRWNKAGVMFENDKGQKSIKLETMYGEAWLSVFDKKSDGPSNKDKFEELGKPISKEDLDQIPF